MRAAECAIDADLEAGRHAEVVGELDALVAAYPLREHLHAERMLALYRAGRQSEALAAYQEARTALVEQIGVEPGAELQHLHDAILAHDPALDLPAAAEPEPPREPPPRTRHLLVGAAAVLIAGVLAFGVIRVLGPEGLSGIDENSVGLIDPDSGHITKQIRVGEAPSAVVDGGGSVWIASAANGTVTRIERADDDRVVIPVGGAPAALVVRRRIAVGGRQRLAGDRAGRSRRQQGRQALAYWQRAALAGVRRRCGVGRVGSRRAHPRSRSRERSRERDDPGGREPLRDRGRRRRAVGGERGVGDGDADRPAQPERPAHRGRQRAERARVRRRRGVGGQPPRRDARADRPQEGLGLVVRRGRPGPDGGGGGGGRRVGGGRGGGLRRPCRHGRAAPGEAVRDREPPGGDRRRRRLRVGRGRCPAERAPGWDVACEPPARAWGGDRARPAALALLHDLGDGAARLAGLRRPRRLPAGRGPRRSHARRCPRHDGADPERRRQDLRLHVAAGAAVLRREARPARPTSGPRWSVSWWPAATGRRR